MIASAADEPLGIRIEDAIAMTRIQRNTAVDRAVAAFSPDGSKLAAVVWRGDLARNVNVYSLLVFESKEMMGASPRPPAAILTRDFEGDPLDQSASPITDLTFLADGRTLAFIGRERDKPAQVYAADLVTRQVRQLTHLGTAVRSYLAGAGGSLRAFSAVLDDPTEAERAARLSEDGVFAAEPGVFPQRRRFMTTSLAVDDGRRAQLRQYFIVRSSAPKLVFDSRQSRPAKPPDLSDPKVAAASPEAFDQDSSLRGRATWTADPQARWALLFPYALAGHEVRPERYGFYATVNALGRRLAAPYGLLDLEDGRIERLLDAPHAFTARDAGPPRWSPDGRSVVLHSLLPLDAGDDETNKRRAGEPPQWLEVDVASRRITKLGIPSGWRVVRWDRAHGLVLSREQQFARMARRADGSWGPLEELGAVSGFSWWHPVATNGRIVVGVREASLTPPELAAYDLETRETRVFTDLNPALRGRRYGAVEPLRWSHKQEPNAFAFVIKPVDYQPGRRYPLVILLDDGLLRQEGEPFLLDGTQQLSGHAIQSLAASGFVVLYPRTPASLRPVLTTPQEGELMRENVETAIAELDRAGLIDPARVGISGWSRAGYHTDYLLMHSPFRFAAASQIDGGSRAYNDGMRPYTDEELRKIRTPLLIEAHGPRNLASHNGAMADRLDAHGKPVEVLYFATASHQTTRPRHRLRSLGTHVDWWRFWLQDYEDPDPAKTAQYSRWRALRSLGETAVR